MSLYSEAVKYIFFHILDFNFYMPYVVYSIALSENFTKIVSDSTFPLQLNFLLKILGS